LAPARCAKDNFGFTQLAIPVLQKYTHPSFIHVITQNTIKTQSLSNQEND